MIIENIISQIAAVGKQHAVAAGASGEMKYEELLEWIPENK